MGGHTWEVCVGASGVVGFHASGVAAWYLQGGRGCGIGEEEEGKEGACAGQKQVEVHDASSNHDLFKR